VESRTTPLVAIRNFATLLLFLHIMKLALAILILQVLSDSASHAAGEDAFARSESNVWVWGSNERGQLGTDTNAAKVSSPTLTDQLNTWWRGKNVTKVVTGMGGGGGMGEYSLVLTSEGRVYSFGDCTTGNLGVGPTLCIQHNCQAGGGAIFCQKAPIEIIFQNVSASSSDRSIIVDVSAGSEHALALADDGTVFAWGSGSKGCLGNGCCDQSYCQPCTGCLQTGQCYFFSPIVSTRLTASTLGSPVSRIFASLDFSMVMTKSGRVFGFGRNQLGQLGLPYVNVTEYTAEPAEVEALRGAEEVCLGTTHGLALMPGGTVLSWGNADLGQTARNFVSPPLPVPMATKARGIGCGAQFSFVIGQYGELYAFGLNTQGQLGFSTIGDEKLCKQSNFCEFQPRLVSSLSTAGVRIVSANGGDGHSIALSEDNKVFVSGDNSFNQLGISSCGSGQTKCFSFLELYVLSAQDILGVAAGANWGMAWQRILLPPRMYPPAGEYGPTKVVLLMDEKESGAYIEYELLEVQSLNQSAADPSSSSPKYQQHLSLDASSMRQFSLKARVACSSCGKSSSSVVEARYSIYRGVSLPSFRSSPDLPGASASFVCYGGPMQGKECGRDGMGQEDKLTCGTGVCAQWTGVWMTTAKVTISSVPAEAKIYYSVGKKDTIAADPDEMSAVYSDPFYLEDTQGFNISVRARAYLSGYRSSDVSTAIFQVRKFPALTVERNNDWLKFLIIAAGVVLFFLLVMFAVYVIRKRKKQRRRVEPIWQVIAKEQEANKISVLDKFEQISPSEPNGKSSTEEAKKMRLVKKWTMADEQMFNAIMEERRWKKMDLNNFANPSLRLLEDRKSSISEMGWHEEKKEQNLQKRPGSTDNPPIRQAAWIKVGGGLELGQHPRASHGQHADREHKPHNHHHRHRRQTRGEEEGVKHSAPKQQQVKSACTPRAWKHVS